MNRVVSVILPAHDEADWIGPCLEALCASEPLPEGWRAEVIVLPNGCRDRTAEIARARSADFAARGWRLEVIEMPQGGKLGALNRGETAASGAIRVYLDADVALSPPLMAQIVGALATETPRYASGTPQVSPARSAITRAYGRFWTRLPFVTTGAPGFGVFAMNAAGRARWGDWPDIISDDTFARLNFAPGERLRLPASYRWPLVEGFVNLVRVRRRQNDGVAEIAQHFPALLGNADAARPRPAQVLRLALHDPSGFLAYGAVALAVKSPLFRNRSRWARGR